MFCALELTQKPMMARVLGVVLPFILIVPCKTRAAEVSERPNNTEITRYGVLK